MLLFQGIRTNRQGAPERYSLRYDLLSSLQFLLGVYEAQGGQKEAVLAEVEARLNRLFEAQGGEGQNRQDQRRQVALWFRTKDIGHFLFAEPALKSLKITVLRLLALPRSVEEKWPMVREQLVAGLKELDPQYGEALLLNPDSGFHRLLDTVALFFLDQDEEPPPQGLEMEFLRQDFPRLVWRRKDQINPQLNPFWQPQNQLCRSLVLEQLVLERLFEDRLLALESGLESAARRPQLASTGPVSLRFGGKDEAPELIPADPTQTLLSLQHQIQRQHSFEGAKHLLAVLRQLGRATEERFEFCLTTHFEWLGKLKKGQQVSDRQLGLLGSVLEALTKVKVVRSTAQGSVETPLLGLWGKRTHACGPGSWELLLDPLVLELGLGRELALVPTEVFLENPQTHGLVPGLSAFLTGCWVLEFAQKKGVFECQGGRLLDAFVLQKSPGQRAGFQAKIKEELKYMVNKAYIGGLEIEPGPSPFEEIYRIWAPPSLGQALAGSVPQGALVG
ncbi:MAG: hypothetical protein A2426_05060 [Candidatus Lambdaproteobacteria bacterium RIFOXYC1_FULL_56_13]|nr:MAG: hypothetical protein A2426_05060 [Candidatus Lambdaproteobacteria bacterium RIFOXYC1_FULL_56_13]